MSVEAINTLKVHRGLTVKEVAARFRVGKDRVRMWIHRGELRATNTAEQGNKPRFVVDEDDIKDFKAARSAATAAPPKKQRRSRLPTVKDYLGAA